MEVIRFELCVYVRAFFFFFFFFFFLIKAPPFCRGVIQLELVCKMFWEACNTDRVWRSCARKLFSDKKGVLEAAVRMSSVGTMRGNRNDLEAMSAGKLKSLCQIYELDTRICVEKVRICKYRIHTFSL